jgi:hypothetical protein
MGFFFVKWVAFLKQSLNRLQATHTEAQKSTIKHKEANRSTIKHKETF